MVILVPDALPGLASRSRADVSLLIGTAAMVLTVPNSALTPLGNAQAMAMTFKYGIKRPGPWSRPGMPARSSPRSPQV